MRLTTFKRTSKHISRSSKPQNSDDSGMIMVRMKFGENMMAVGAAHVRGRLIMEGLICR